MPGMRRLAAVLAGEDVEAVNRVRRQLDSIPPSSPAIALFVDEVDLHDRQQLLVPVAGGREVSGFSRLHELHHF